jgi:hypothetical protein
MKNEHFSGVVLSQFNWKPGSKGSDFTWSKGQAARYRKKDGNYIPVTLAADGPKHHVTGIVVCEVEFPDGIFAVDADRLEPA